MFSKAFRVKSNSQMKGSDKKKLRADLKKRFGRLNDDDLNALVPTKSDVVIAKIQTFSGENVLLYVHDRKPAFFQLDGEFFPTVYTLWRFPEDGRFMEAFTTWPDVVKKLQNGADLMLPGVIVDKEALGANAYGGRNRVKGEAMYVRLSNNRAAVAVGKTALSGDDMYMAGGRGKALNVLHCYGDHLWESGTREELPELGPPQCLDFLTKDADEIRSDVEELSLDNNQQEEPEETVDQVEDDKVDEIPLTMDEMLESAFLQAWKTTAKKAELPLLTSNFFRQHMLAFDPNLDMKKSSFKKLSKFLSAMQSEGIIRLAELQKGVESIVEVDPNHDKIRSHRVIKRVADENAVEEEIVLPCDRKYEVPEVVELWTVSAVTLPFFSENGLTKGSPLTSAQVREAIKSYTVKNSLHDGDGVKLDPVLAGIVLRKGENDVVRLRWDEVAGRMMEKMSRAHSVNGVLRKGEQKPVDISVASRSGNKKVTLVRNLDAFGIDPGDFAAKCRTGVQASTSIQPNEVLVQGNQTIFASKLLLQDYKLPRKYIKGLEEGKKSKKKK